MPCFAQKNMVYAVFPSEIPIAPPEHQCMVLHHLPKGASMAPNVFNQQIFILTQGVRFHPLQAAVDHQQHRWPTHLDRTAVASSNQPRSRAATGQQPHRADLTPVALRSVSAPHHGPPAGTVRSSSIVIHQFG
ncbi:hypothetical protein ACLOJK_007085 [Asimina triloba]